MTKACTAPTADCIDGGHIRRHVPHIPGRIIGPAGQQTVNVMKSVQWGARALLLAALTIGAVHIAAAQTAPDSHRAGRPRRGQRASAPLR